MRLNKYLPFLFLFLLAGCSKFEYDPNQSVNLKSADRLNFGNLSRIEELGLEGELVFAVVGDTHLDYENLDKMVGVINQDKEMDFVVHVGDITDHGLLKEFEWSASIMQKLQVPYLVTIGNHDVLARGEEVYRHMYGATDFSFVIDSLKFILFNSNGREYDFKGQIPNMGWLENELTTGDFNRAILFSHVPYYDRDFDQALKPSYLRLLNRVNESTPILAGFNGHLHEPGVRQVAETPVIHLLPGAVNRRTYLKIRINNEQMTYESVYF